MEQEYHSKDSDSIVDLEERFSWNSNHNLEQIRSRQSMDDDDDDHNKLMKRNENKKKSNRISRFSRVYSLEIFNKKNRGQCNVSLLSDIDFCDPSRLN